ncbi:MAG: hypothetical protein KDA59_25660 [Planctomycetales bacterium]|nr:hypothetical protein [Planctomycetales bacterium]
MRLAQELSPVELEHIVSSIQRFLFWDEDTDGPAGWNLDRPCSGADLVDHVTELLVQHDLAPTNAAGQLTD